MPAWREQTDVSPFRVVFVCTGNRARSPLAAELFRRHTLSTEVTTSSLGVLELGPVPALCEAIKAGAAVGVDIRAHRAQALSRSSLADADLVVGFEPFHVASGIVDGGALPGRTFTLPELAELCELLDLPERLRGPERARVGVTEVERARSVGARTTPPSLADPFGEPQRVFDRLARELDALTGRVAAALLGPAQRESA